jgi:F0F1-type ATP synthase assembly protein I
MIDQVVQQLNQEQEARLRVERQLQSARNEIISLREQICNSIKLSLDLISGKIVMMPHQS